MIGQHIRLLPVDHSGQGGELGLEPLLLCLGGAAIGEEEVLHVQVMTLRLGIAESNREASPCVGRVDQGRGVSPYPAYG